MAVRLTYFQNLSPKSNRINATFTKKGRRTIMKTNEEFNLEVKPLTEEQDEFHSAQMDIATQISLISSIIRFGFAKIFNEASKSQKAYLEKNDIKNKEEKNELNNFKTNLQDQMKLSL